MVGHRSLHLRKRRRGWRVPAKRRWAAQPGRGRWPLPASQVHCPAERPHQGPSCCAFLPAVILPSGFAPGETLNSFILTLKILTERESGFECAVYPRPNTCARKGRPEAWRSTRPMKCENSGRHLVGEDILIHFLQTFIVLGVSWDCFCWKSLVSIKVALLIRNHLFFI